MDCEHLEHAASSLQQNMEMLSMPKFERRERQSRRMPRNQQEDQGARNNTVVKGKDLNCLQLSDDEQDFYTRSGHVQSIPFLITRIHGYARPDNKHKDRSFSN